MLIIPLHRKPTAANWPWVTTLFVLINVFVYFALQSKDNKAEARAQIYYFEQKLDEIEFPLYLAYHERGHSQDTGYDFDTLQNVLRGPAYRDLLFTAVNLDHGFQRALADGGALAEQRQARDPEGRWAHTRATVETLLGYGTTWNYALRYDRIEFRRLFGSMFLHGSFGHLFGNMIFLALLGLLVEGALGSALYAMLYVLAGLGSALFSVYWRYGESGFGVGASGAIAGLMGAYCVLWGMRKVRFFYWFFVVFNYVRAPALVLLPLWLGWEVWQLLTNTGSNVSFDAHAGGIVSGALLAVLIRFCRLQRTSFMEDDSLPSQDKRGEAQEALRNELGRMDWFAARRAAEQLQQIDPDSFESRVLIWRAWSTATAAPPEQHAAARAALTAQPFKLDQLAERKRIWTDYLRVSGGRPRLTRDELLQLGQRFASLGELELGLGLLRALRADSAMANAVCAALFGLALQLHERQPDACRRIAEQLRSDYPDAAETAKLGTLLSG